jgi:hypothetical protein
LEPVEFVELNFDFHPKAVQRWLQDLDFRIQKILTVSHFRLGLFKRFIPTGILVALDSFFQWTGKFWQLTPSVFVRAGLDGERGVSVPEDIINWFKCPKCENSLLEFQKDYIHCASCNSNWAVRDGIFDFREPLSQ